MRGRNLPLNPSLILGAVLCALLAAAAVAAPWLAPYDPDEQTDPPAARYRPPGTVLQAVRLAGGTWRLAERVERVGGELRIERLGRVEVLPASRVLNLGPEGVADRRVFLLGSDRFGRDLLSRILFGARVSLGVGLTSLVLALTLGVAVGSLAALGGPVADLVTMRFVDALLSFPWMFLMLLLVALFSPGTGTLVLVLGATGWMSISRLTRAEILALKERDFIVAARALGAGPLWILRRHLLPNALAPVIVQAALLTGTLILVESSLSFLGLGIQPPTPSWGNMVADGRTALLDAWWVAVVPGTAIVVTVIAFNLLGDGLRDALDPRRSGGAPPRA